MEPYDEEEWIKAAFNFHPATEKTGPLHDTVRRVHMELALGLLEIVPDCPERAQATEFLRQSMMYCNAAIAIYGNEGPDN